MRRFAFGMTGLVALAIAGCQGDAPEPSAEQTDIPDEIAAAAPAPALIEGAEQIGTPMAERMATLGIVNKRNNISRDVEMRPGESRRIDDVILRLSACERTAPWEEMQETGAFVQVFVNDRPNADADAVWGQVFSGWLFKQSPSRNVVEHPVYDVWVKDCAMSFPGEEEVVESADS